MLELARPGEGRRQVSWIWYRLDDDDLRTELSGELGQPIQVEWMKSRARAARWREAVILAEERMRRVIQYSYWKAQWWEDRKYARQTDDASLKEGLVAYAKEHKQTELWLAKRLTAAWAGSRERARSLLASCTEASGAPMVSNTLLDEEMEESAEEE